MPSSVLCFGWLACISAGGSQLRHFLSWFPNGRIGIGLLLLRMGMAAWAADASLSLLVHSQSCPLWLGVAGFVIALAAVGLAAGLVTPAFGLVVALCGIAASVLNLKLPELYSVPGMFACLQTVLPACAIVLLGPGAYSVDAILFGRREIVIPTRSSHSSD